MGKGQTIRSGLPNWVVTGNGLSLEVVTGYPTKRGTKQTNFIVKSQLLRKGKRKKRS